MEDKKERNECCGCCSKNLVLLLIGVLELVAAACALSAMEAKSLINTSADGEVYYTIMDTQYQCGNLSADVVCSLDRFEFDAQMDITTFCEDYVECSYLGMKDKKKKGCVSKKKYKYKNAEKKFCKASSNSTSCKAAKKAADISEAYVAMSTVGYVALFCTGVFLICYALIRGFFYSSTADEKVGCCTQYALELMVMAVNLVCATLFVVGFALWLGVKYHEDNLDDFIGESLNEVYEGEGVGIDWTINKLSDGDSVAPMATAFAICYVVFSYMAISAFCTSLYGLCSCCCPEQGRQSSRDRHSMAKTTFREV